MQIVLEWLLTIGAACTVFLMHDFVLRRLAKRTRSIRMVWIMLVLALSHVAHIWVYAFAIFAAVDWFELGRIEMCTCDTVQDYVYFSAVNYTSLGYGDFIPLGSVRLLATFEGLVGLMMIGWSTAFAFWWMSKHWLSQKEL